MSDPPITFLTLEEVLEIHRDQIARYGGTSGIRDVGLVESAVATPRATYGGQYLCADLYEMAATMMYSLSRTTHSSTETSGSGPRQPGDE